jgi:hypothetical protein
MGHLLTVAKQSWLGQECRNTFYWGGNDAVMANAQDIVDALAACWSDNIDQYLDNGWSLYGFDVYDKTIPGVPGVEYTPTAGAVPGTGNSAEVATQLAALVTFKGQVAPPNTNRKYLAGALASSLVDSKWNSTFLAAMQAWGEQVLEVPTATSLAIAFEVVTLNEDGTVAGGNILENAFARAIPATLRSRRLGVGS